MIRLSDSLFLPLRYASFRFVVLALVVLLILTFPSSFTCYALPPPPLFPPSLLRLAPPPPFPQQIVDKYIGESARLVREMFAYAREHEPCIIFMDEIDAIGGRRFSEGTSADREIQRTLMEVSVLFGVFCAPPLSLFHSLPFPSHSSFSLQNRILTSM